MWDVVAGNPPITVVKIQNAVKDRGFHMPVCLGAWACHGKDR
jgi:hypothetical protein